MRIYFVVSNCHNMERERKCCLTISVWKSINFCVKVLKCADTSRVSQSHIAGSCWNNVNCYTCKKSHLPSLFCVGTHRKKSVFFPCKNSLLGCVRSSQLLSMSVWCSKSHISDPVLAKNVRNSVDLSESNSLQKLLCPQHRTNAETFSKVQREAAGLAPLALPRTVHICPRCRVTVPRVLQPPSVTRSRCF